MPYIQLDGQQYALDGGNADVGSSADAAIRLIGAGVEPVCATLSVIEPRQVLLQRRGHQPVRVNGVPIGEEPTPLMHGDKIEIAGRELYFGDDRKAGNTAFVPSVHPPDARSRYPTPGRPFGATGGRLVSLVDGREYAVPISGLVIGRDPTCDVVVASGDVSRKHAVVAPGAEGYVLTDTSTNGLVLNGRAAPASQTLTRGDIVRIGGEEFRFHADGGPANRGVMATLEVINPGVAKGTLYEISMPLAHVGRGAHNDIVIPDESISDSHAKFQRRDIGWFVVDMGSTNGTYVGGRRIEGEAPLLGAPDVRFGGVKFVFRPSAADGSSEMKGTRAIAAPRLDRLPPREAVTSPSAPPAAAAALSDDDLFRRPRVSPVVWLAFAAVLALCAFLYLQS
ncbi:MAG: FHA domain-containing protein [Gemmatimonadota bacterium]|nr:FHA domain-containing protein [Gemmatimonadota bacterium]